MKRLIVALALLLLSAPSIAQQGSLFVPTGCPSTGCRGANTVFQAKAVNLAATGDQGSVVIPSSITRYQILAIAVTNCSTTPVLASFGIFTAAGGTGTTIVTAATISGATSATLVLPSALAGISGTTMLTATPLFVNVAVANALALTCDIGIRIQDWT